MQMPHGSVLQPSGIARWGPFIALALAAAYALLSHVLMLSAPEAPWAVAVLLGPLLAMAVGMAWKQRHWPITLAALAAVGGLAVLVASGGLGSVNRLYVAQHVGIHLALGAVFGSTLRSAELSMIGRFATRAHGPLTAAKRAYTRQVTAVWTAYFFAMAALSLWVYAAAAWDRWSLLANLGTPIGIAVLFVGEHLLRWRLHPEFERTSLTSALRAATGRDGPSP